MTSFVNLKSAIQELIDKGVSPKQLQSEIFNIIDCMINDKEVIHVLYNKCYGGFSFSEDFLKHVKDNMEGETRSGDDDDAREHFYKYLVSFRKMNNITMEEALVAASGKYCQLAVEQVPKHRKYFIHEYDGSEWIEILKEFRN